MDRDRPRWHLLWPIRKPKQRYQDTWNKIRHVKLDARSSTVSTHSRSTPDVPPDIWTRNKWPSTRDNGTRNSNKSLICLQNRRTSRGPPNTGVPHPGLIRLDGCPGGHRLCSWRRLPLKSPVVTPHGSTLQSFVGVTVQETYSNSPPDLRIRYSNPLVYGPRDVFSTPLWVRRLVPFVHE